MFNDAKMNFNAESHLADHSFIHRENYGFHSLDLRVKVWETFMVPGLDQNSISRHLTLNINLGDFFG